MAIIITQGAEPDACIPIPVPRSLLRLDADGGNDIEKFQPSGVRVWRHLLEIVVTDDMPVRGVKRDLLLHALEDVPQRV